MSGSEIVPVGKVASDVAKKALSEKEWQQQQLAELAAQTDEMKGAASKYAKRVEIKQAALLRLYQPLARLVGFQREYFDEEFGRDLASKTAHILDENLVTPRASVAFPAMQGLGYSLDEPELKEMYLNLLATATDGRRQSTAHPAFAETIKQLAPEEASALQTALEVGAWPMIEVRRVADGMKYSVARRHIVYMVNTESGEPVRSAECNAWIDNWVRLGLFETSYSTSFAREGAYDWAEDHPDVVEERSVAETDGLTVVVQRGRLDITAFGKRFAAAIADPPPADSAIEDPES
ncbi:MAG: DUF4393 domain-containing protein [Nocardioides sp.]|uniref:DUF4393 domain-containing protein n=1 Tax=Nocardioides sp. TaxID=35761 RepID=UPI0032669264